MAADLVIVPPQVFPQTAADYIARAIREAQREGAPVAVALSGGRVPRPVYARLARSESISWDRVEIFFADERAVPPDDGESNFRLVMETLGVVFSGRPQAIHRMEADRADLGQAALEYESQIPPALDVLVLGMGADGHTASLFPGDPAVGEARRRVVAITGPSSLPWRMTITPPVIRAARATLMLVAGAPKAAAVARALAGPFDPLQCPAQLAREGTWILDQPAAEALDTGRS